MNYIKLNLPSFPLKSDKVDELLNNSNFRLIITDYKSVINDQLLQIFESLNLEADHVIIFKQHHPAERSIERSLAHIDVVYDNNEWIKVPCVINWEIFPTNIKWIYLKPTGDHKIIYPELEKITNPDQLLHNGIHYVKRHHVGIDNFEIEDSFEYSGPCGPTLFKTNKFHAVSYSAENNRMSVSIRFKVTSLTSWESAVSKFSNYILK
jgi:hypothetical protein